MDAMMLRRFMPLTVGLLSLALAANAAPPKQAAKLAENSDDTVAPAETPALPYLTVLLARDPAVQAELSLKSRQIEEVTAAIAEVDEPLWKLRDVPVKNCGAELDALLSKLLERLQTVLTAPQQERWEELILQARGSKALASPEVAERLRLSPDQASKLRGILTDLEQERAKIEKEIAALPAAKQQASRAKLRKSETQKLADLLSSKQQASWKALLGKPFDLSRVRQIGCVAPELRDVAAWINTDTISLKEQRGKVVVVHFWAFGCINCIRNLPHYQGWQEKFPASAVTIIGIHTPETESERDVENLRRQVRERKIAYPVAFDGASENWKAWGNNMWPSVYLIDKQGRVRNWWYGELNWEGAQGEEFMRKRIEELIAEE